MELTEEWVKQEYGESVGSLFVDKAYHLAHFQEIFWHHINWPALQYDFLWVIEQDVAWQGNLFDAFATFASWPDDFLCFQPSLKEVGGNWGQNWRGINTTTFHSGWIDRTPKARIHHCFVFVARYSAAFLNQLSLHHESGKWAYVEHEAAELCAQTTGCTVGDISRQKQCSDVIGNPFTATGKGVQGHFNFTHDVRQTKIYHKVKE